MDWNDRVVTSVQEFDEALATLSTADDPAISRGQSRSRWGLQPSIDRLADTTAVYRVRLDEERSLLQQFETWAPIFLAPLERACVKNCRPRDWILPATVAQHFGAPTRLLDWTNSPWVAAYFAVVDDRDEEGAVWWFRERAFDRAAGEQWERLGWRRGDDGQIALNHYAFEPDCPEFISKCHLPIPFERPAAQQGLFTISSPLGRDQRPILARLLSESDYGRIVIPSALKTQSLEMLRRKNVDAQSLRHAGADRVGLRMAWELYARRNPNPAGLPR